MKQRIHATTSPNPSALLYSAKEVAVLLGIGVSTVWIKAEAGELPAPVKISEGCTRWRKADLEKYLAAFGVNMDEAPKIKPLTIEEILVKQTITACINHITPAPIELKDLVKWVTQRGYSTALVKQVISRMINTGELIGTVDEKTAYPRISKGSFDNEQQ